MTDLKNVSWSKPAYQDRPFWSNDSHKNQGNKIKCHFSKTLLHHIYWYYYEQFISNWLTTYLLTRQYHGTMSIPVTSENVEVTQSDNGLNFVGTDSQLKDAFKTVDWSIPPLLDCG